MTSISDPNGEPVSVNEKVFDALVQFQYERN